MAKESVLLLGNGAREHALGWKIKQSPLVGDVYFASGNAGTEQIGTNLDFAATDIDKAAAFAHNHQIDLTIVGPEVPLAAGIVDFFQESWLRIFGPTKAAARIESSKIWSDKFMGRHGIPHPTGISYQEGQMEYALNFLGLLQLVQQHTRGSEYAKAIVIKADGLAAGKGVELPDDDRQARMAIQNMMSGRSYGDAGKSILIQGRLNGKELSVIGISDGERITILPPARDYKRLLDEDKGPNTGGMGAYSPVEDVTPDLLENIRTNILQKAVDGMKKEGNLYKGVLYAGLIITDNGPQVLEFNCRFGDPETMPQMMLLRSDLYPILKASAEGNLDPVKVSWRSGAAVSFVLAAEGYPGKIPDVDMIHGLDINRPPSIQIFHAGTRQDGDVVVTNGGRVLGVTAYGRDLYLARIKALQTFGSGPEDVGFKGMQYRLDVAKDAASLLRIP